MTRRLLRIILTVLVNAMCFTQTNAQSVSVNITDGSDYNFVLDEVRSISFTEQTMSINLTSGSVTTWDYTQVSSFGYSGLLTNLVGSRKSNPIELNVYPNPSNSEVVIEYNMYAEGNAQIVVTDMSGRVHVVINESGIVGKNQFVWNGRDYRGRPVPTGSYICQVIVNQSSMVQTIIINR